MYIKRFIEDEILAYLDNYTKPICILGARQVGKSTVIKHCLKDTDSVYINLFDTPGADTIFSDISVSGIISRMEVVLERKISTGCIIVIDEIQSIPAAVAAIKSFNEDNNYKLVVLGSNFGSFILNKSKYSFPVGQYKKIQMYPLSYFEFAHAYGKSFLCDTLLTQLNKGQVDDVLHQKHLDLFDKYIAIGGMPEVVKGFLSGLSLDELEAIKSNLIDGYLMDFGKYEFAIENTKALNVIYKSIPQFLNKDNQKFIFTEINYEYKQLVNSFKWLDDNNYIIKVAQINNINMPLIAQVKQSSFKLFNNEVSLLIKQANYDPFTIIRQQDKVYYGFVMENYIATVLSKYSEIYTYRKSSTEIDFMYENNNRIYALEVKSGNNTKAKSLRAFKDKHPHAYAIKLSRNNLSLGDITTIPLYAIDILLASKMLDQLVKVQ